MLEIYASLILILTAKIKARISYVKYSSVQAVTYCKNKLSRDRNIIDGVMGHTYKTYCFGQLDGSHLICTKKITSRFKNCFLI
jgi:hypothetical protein